MADPYGKAIWQNHVARPYENALRQPRPLFCIGEPKKYMESLTLKNDVQKSKRMVRYNGLPEASKIPGKYHGWLHHYSEKFPSDNEKKHEWQKKHLPNLTGTKYAYSPKNVSENFGRNEENDEYKPWTPS